MEPPKNIPQGPGEQQKPKEDVTLTLFDALQATKPVHRASAKSSIEIVGESVGSSPSRNFSISPRLLIALAVTAGVSLAAWLIPNRSPKIEAPQAARYAPPPSAPAPALPRLPTTQVQRNWNTSAGAGVGTASLPSAEEAREKERERERDREYEREREREKRRQMEAWGEDSSAPTVGSTTSTRGTENPGLDSARGYKNSAATLRDKEREQRDAAE